MDERIQKYEDKMKKTLSSLESELVTIRAGRANPHILDKLAVDYYGAPTPLQQVANITVPEARMIQIQPWESSLIKGIEKAILTSDLGLNPSNDGKVIRLVFPELTEERRKELVGEGQRFFDAMRNNETIVRYSSEENQGWHYSLLKESQSFDRTYTKALLPIPVSETNANPTLKAQQNPGY